ncbi:MAG: hypothetical protein IOB84_12570 [Brevundimonas sp.]|nr:hypothetical protein [Brevundimonas sp.]
MPDTMIEREPVRTLADLATLDDAEIEEGYRDGRAGDPEPGNNRSRAALAQRVAKRKRELMFNPYAKKPERKP